jgi:predicted GNAT family acetyltransferase
MADVTITREDNPAKGRYVAKVAGIDGEGELTYSRVNPHLIIADHTGVPDAFRGMRVARALVQRLVDDARAGRQDYSACPGVSAGTASILTGRRVRELVTSASLGRRRRQCRCS